MSGQIKAVLVFQGILVKGEGKTADVKDEKMKVIKIEDKDPWRDQKLKGILRQIELLMQKMLKYKEANLEINIISK